MARPLRIDYADAWYLVINCGRRSENIFVQKSDYNTFLDLLIESVNMWQVRIGAYCLLPHQYHLLIQTPAANLPRCMRHVNGLYAQRFNRTHRCDGPLFRGRYKSILIDAAAHLPQIMRYIHRTPLRYGLAESLEAYRWSSHRGYLSSGERWQWLHKNYVLSLLCEDEKSCRQIYEDYVGSDDSEEIARLFQKKNLPAILGSKAFVDAVRRRFSQEKIDAEIPASNILAPAREEIKRAVCREYDVKAEVLHGSRRGTYNEPRNVAIFLTRHLRGDRLADIAREFHLKRYSSASSAVQRVRARCSKDATLRKRVELLGLKITEDQTQL